MGVVVDVVLAVAVVAVAPGAVAELQLRVGAVSAPADGAFVGIVLLDLGLAEGDGFVGCGVGGLFLELPLPAPGQDIDHILAEEQKVVHQRDHREQIVGPGVDDQAPDHHHQIHQSENPCLHRDEEKQHELGIGEQGGVGQKQAHIQVGGVCEAPKEHTEYIHHHHAPQVEQVKAQGAPDGFNGLPNAVVAEEHDCGKEDVATVIDKGVGDQPPDLAGQNQIPVKVQKGGYCPAGVDHVHEIDDGSAHGDIEHQIADALVPVAVAEAVELGTKIFQKSHLLLFVAIL